MNATAKTLFRAYEHLERARGPLQELPGMVDEGFGDAVLREIGWELDHLIRRIRNAALLHGADPAAIEKIQRTAA